jgi:hypothetical protein
MIYPIINLCMIQNQAIYYAFSVFAADFSALLTVILNHDIYPEQQCGAFI